MSKIYLQKKKRNLITVLLKPYWGSSLRMNTEGCCVPISRFEKVIRHVIPQQWPQQISSPHLLKKHFIPLWRNPVIATLQTASMCINWALNIHRKLSLQKFQLVSQLRTSRHTTSSRRPAELKWESCAHISTEV